MAVLQYPFKGGPNQKLAREYLDPNANMVDVVNGVYNADDTVDKRLGIAPLASAVLSGSAMGAPVKMLSRQSEVLVTDGDALYGYAPDGATPGWTERALVPPCVATRTPALTLPGNGQGHTMAEGAGRRMIVWLDAVGNVYYALQSIASGSFIVPVTQINTSAGPPIVVFAANTFVIFAAITSTTRIFYWSFNANGVNLTFGNLVTDCEAGQPFDASPEVGGPGILFFYAQEDADGISSSPRYIRLESLPLLSIGPSAVLVNYQGSGSNVTKMACRYDAPLGVTWFFWSIQTSGGLLQYVASVYVAATWAPITASFTFTTAMPSYASNQTPFYLAVEPLSAAQAVLLAGVRAGPNVAFTTQVAFNNAGSSATAAAQYGAELTAGGEVSALFSGRPFRAAVGVNTRCYVPVTVSQQNTPTSAYFRSVLLMDTGAYTANATVRARVAATLAPRQAAPGGDGVAVPSGIGTPASGTFRSIIGVVEGEEFSILTASISPQVSWYIAQWDFTDATAFQYCESNAESYVSCGTPAVLTSTAMTELSFFSWPVITSLTQTTGGQMTLLGVYQYAFCWAQVDESGLIHRSAFWTQQVTLGGTNDAVQIVAVDLPFTSRYATSTGPLGGATSRQVYLEIYRSQANQTILYFDGTIASSPIDTAYATPLTATDNTADAALATSDLQYTTGGVLDSINPPSSRAMIRHVDRLWMIDDTGLVIWYSTNFNAGDAPYFNESLTLSFTQEPLTALADMDDKIVAFSATSIWYVEGYGPAVTGLGSDLTTAVKVPTDTGAADWRSVVTVPTVGQFPGGVFFQSPSNSLLYLLDRGLSVTCVGKVVQEWFQATPTTPAVTVLAATTVPLTTQIRFVLSSGYVATYDYVQQAWSRQLYPPPIVHAIVPVGGSWTAAGSDGFVYAELPASSAVPCFDTLSSGLQQWITTTITLADVKPGGLQGAGQVEFVQGLSRQLDPCDVHATLFYDYASTSESWTFAYSALHAQSTSLGQWRISPSATLSQPMAVRLQVSDAPPTGGVAVTGQGMRWLGVAFSLSTIGPVYDKLGVGVKQ